MKSTMFLVLGCLLTGSAFAADDVTAGKLLKELKSSTKPDGAAALNQLYGRKYVRSTIEALNEERISYEIETNLIHRWEEAWREKSSAKLGKLTADSFSSSGWTPSAPTTDSSGLFTKSEWKPSGAAGAEAFQSYPEAFATLEDISLDHVATDPVEAGDFEKSEFPQRAKALVRFDLRGKTAGGELRTDRGIFEVLTVRSGSSPQWKLESVKLVKGESLVAPRAWFADATAKFKLDAAPVMLRGEAIRRGGFALSLADYNNDGKLDLYFGSEKNSILYRGQPDGSFAKDESFNFPEEKSVKTAIFADLNNDGWADLISVKFVPSENRMVSVFMNHNGRFEKKDKNFANPPPDYAMPAAVADFNGDGKLDLYVGYPGFRDFTHMENGHVRNLVGKSAHGLYLNDGHGVLLDTKPTTFVGVNSLKFKDGGALYPHSAIAFDYDGDGKQDLVVMDDRGGLSSVFKNLGGGKFTNQAQQIGLSNEGYGMGTAVADYDHDGFQDVVMTNVDFNAALRLVNTHDRRKSGTEVSQGMARGLVLFRNNGKGKFVRQEGAGLEWSGLGAGGAEFVDFDNDGWMDLYVTNGLWSGTLRHEDLSSYFVRAMSIRLALDRPVLDYDQSGIMRILKEYPNGLENSDIKGSSSMAGYQRNRMFRNNGNGTFTEVGYLAGVDSLADGYIVARADLNADGKMDLVLRNADPGTPGYQFPSVQAFENQTPVNNRSLVVTLQGSRSNREGIGATVTATIGGKKIVQQRISNNGSAQSEPTLHFGLGKQTVVSKLEVRWPSGHKSTLTNVKPGSILVKEDSHVRIGGI